MAVAGLQRIVQQDFSGGMFPSLAPELIPPNGAFDINNGLLNEQDVCYRRGGSTYFSNVDAGAPPRLLWSGYLKNGGLQTLLAAAGGVWRVEADKSLHAITLATPASLVTATVFQGTLYLPGGKTWDGSGASTIAMAKAHYATAGNRLIAGEGSRVVVSNVPKKEGDPLVFEETIFKPTMSTTEKSATATVSSAAGLVVGMPVFCGAGGVPPGTVIEAIAGTTLTLSSPATITAASVPCSIGEANYFSLPEGSQITGLMGWRTSCLVFTTQGIWILSGLARNQTDPNGNLQWSQDRYSADAVLWGKPGVAAWKGGVVVPCKDDIWLMELGVSSERAAPFRSISGAIQNIYRAHVAAGHVPGQAVVFNGHYFLPILSPNGETCLELLVCRLTGVNSAGHPEVAWTRLSGYGAALGALATTVSGTEGPLIGATATNGRVLKLAYFAPNASVENDADGTPVPFELTMRSVPTGNLVPNTVVKLRLSYRMVAFPETTVSVGFGGSAYGAEWGAFNYGEANWVRGTGSFEDLGASLPPAKADPEAIVPKTWRVGKKVRFARMRIVLNGPASQFSVRAVELFVRSSGRTV